MLLVYLNDGEPRSKLRVHGVDLTVYKSGKIDDESDKLG